MRSAILKAVLIISLLACLFGCEKEILRSRGVDFDTPIGCYTVESFDYEILIDYNTGISTDYYIIYGARGGQIYTLRVDRQTWHVLGYGQEFCYN